MNKGKQLEKLVNAANLSYRLTKRALILKNEPPVTITQKGLVINSGPPDYGGILEGGTHIVFDCKECKSSTSFPLANLKQHQYVHLDFANRLGAISFLMIWFTEKNKDVYITPMWIIRKYMETEKRKSIPYKEFNTNWITPVATYLDKIIELTNELKIINK